MVSKYYVKDRIEREKLIKEIGIGKEIATFRVDKGRSDEAELHTITSTGIIIIRNEKTHKLVTKLIARPNQIKKYFDKDTEMVKKLILVAEAHQKRGYNKI